MIVHEIPLRSTTQRDVAVWSVDSVTDYYEAEGDEYGVPEGLEELDVSATHLMLPDIEEVIDDLLYRLENQLQGMAEGEWDNKAAQKEAAAAMRLADKIRKTTGR